MTKIAGVYIIQSIKNPCRIYVGSSHDIRNRKNQHFRALFKGKHHSIKLQRHYNKYGSGDLVFEIIESGDYFSKEHLLSREQGWCYHFQYKDSWTPYFNTCPVVGSTQGIKGQVPWNKGRVGVYSEETMALMRKNNGMRDKLPSGAFKKGNVPWNKGLTKETSEIVANIALKEKGRKGRTPWNKGLTKETDERLRAAGEKSSEKKKGREAWNKGKKGGLSEETLTKMSDASKGRIPWNKGKKGIQVAWNKGLTGELSHLFGKKFPKSFGEKISRAQRGIPETDDVKEKLSQVMTAFYQTPEGKEAIEKAKLTKKLKKLKKAA